MSKSPEYVLNLLEKAIAERNNENGLGGATKVADEMGISSSLISQLRTKVYPNPGKKLYPLIIERYGQETVKCPARRQEDIPLRECASERAKPFSILNSEFARQRFICAKCPNNPKGGKS